MSYVKYRAIDRFEIDLRLSCNVLFHILPKDEIYISINENLYGYIQYSSGLHVCFPMEMFDQISQYIEIVQPDCNSQKDAKDDHAGQIYNPITEKWSWF